MHEWALACELVRQAEAEAAARGASRVLSVTVRAGVLTGVVPELLARAYEMARQGTVLEGAPLEVQVAPARALCAACGTEATFHDFGLVCPACGAIGLTVLSGGELVLSRMELEVEGGEGLEAEAHV